MRQIQRQGERVLGRGSILYDPTTLSLDSLEFDKTWRGDANGASEMRTTEGAKRDLQVANEDRPRPRHPRLADLNPAGLA